MSSSTILNGVTASRIHKSNAPLVAEDAEDAIGDATFRLLALAACAPHNVDDGDGLIPWVDYVLREVRESLETIKESTLTAFFAQYIIDYPSECVDENARV